MDKIPQLGRPAKEYPFSGLMVGKGFEIPKDPGKTNNQQTTMLLSSAKTWARRNGKPWRFRTAATADTIRIWRVE